jgi:rubrerythrin
MTTQYTLQEALKLAIQTEKESMEFYRKAASMTNDAESKRVFTLLANEEIGHLKAFFDHYKGGDLGTVDAYLLAPPEKVSATHQALEQALQDDVHEQKAMEIALAEEKATIELYTVMAKEISDPQVRHIFETVVRETQGHYDMIEDEYMRVMTMVSESDQNIYVRDD